MEIFQYSFMVNALIASLLASVAFGLVGSYVVVKRIVFITGGIAHSAYGGIGLGYLLSFNPLFGAAGFSLATAGIVSRLRGKEKQSEDTLIGIMWAVGMALGILFIGLTPGYTPDLMSYLFGNILVIGISDIILMLVLDFVIVVTILYYFNEFQAVTFDEEFAKSLGINTEKIYLILLLLIALTVVVLIKLVGIILVIALMSIPGAIAIKFARSIKQMMTISVLLGLIFTILGLFISYYLNLASGASIILLSGIGYILASLFKRKTN